MVGKRRERTVEAAHVSSKVGETTIPPQYPEELYLPNYADS
jgi:hypothetical protein